MAQSYTFVSFIFLIFFSTFSEIYSSPKATKVEAEDDEPTVNIDVTHEIASDWIWRGQSFGGDYLSRRNSESYKEFSQSFTYVPNARVSHHSGFFFELEGNIALQNRSDRDTDQRIQSFSGGPSVDLNRLNERLMAGNFFPDQKGHSLFFDPNNGVYNDKCSPDLPQSIEGNQCAVNPSRVKTYNEKNGMGRTDGLFTTFAYEIETNKIGKFTVGSWWYFKKDRAAKYTWNEFFIWWELPFFQQSLAPTIQTFKQTSSDDAGGYGNQYTSFSISHTFFKEKLIQLNMSSSIGYQWANNYISQKSGVNDVTNNAQFEVNDYFLSLNHVYRPDIYLYDNERFFYTNSQDSAAVANLSERDGRTVDPSRLFGYANELVYQSINQQNAPEAVTVLARDLYQSQNIPRNLFWISIGVNQRF